MNDDDDDDDDDDDNADDDGFTEQQDEWYHDDDVFGVVFVSAKRGVDDATDDAILIDDVIDSVSVDGTRIVRWNVEPGRDA